MKKMHARSRLLSLLLVLALLCGFAAPASATGAHSAGVSFTQVDNSAVSASLLEQEAEEKQEPGHASTDVVRVSIVLKKESTLEAGFQAEHIGSNPAAMTYRGALVKEQAQVQEKIECATGEKLDVVWNLTVAANLISANVAYGQIEAIEGIPEVERVFLETQYEPAVVQTDLPADPHMSTSPSMIGSNAAWAAGYTGAGSRIAIIDTGTDTDHQSLDEGAFLYSLSQQAEAAGMTEEAYLEKLDLLDEAEIAAVLSQLHVNATAKDLYRNAKLPFAFNYVDRSLDVTHDNDTQTEHGSHVAGIAAANAYIPGGDGTYVKALDEVLMQGVAPDAQIITMKVFGKNGGAYDSDYMVAIEDAVLLGCDAVNLSLGASSPGTSRHASGEYQRIMENLEKSGIVASMAAGNAGAWMENASSGGYLYDDDVSMQTNGTPGTYTNSLSVASVDNRGITGEYFTVGGSTIVYTQSTTYGNLPLTTLAGEQRYVYIDGYGAEADWAAVGEALKGAVAVCSRGGISFYQKANAAIAAGAIATVVYNNEMGSINMDLTGYGYTAPCISVTQGDGATLKEKATPVTGSQGNVLYYQGKLTVQEGVGSQVVPGTYNTMSTFSSWGVPGSLEMKPEITAPGGGIYSLNGSHRSETGGSLLGGSDDYESMSGTSMASPQVAGMAALLAQYIRETGLAEQTGLTSRQLAQSLLMSTAVPQREEENGGAYYPVLRQGAGLANVGAAIAAESYILMGEDATRSHADGKVKVELGDDPEKTGSYQFSFSIHNLTDRALSYELSADFFTQAVFTENGTGYLDTRTAALDATVEFSTGKTVTVPAGGVANVQVAVVLTDEQKAALQTDHPTGAYVEGFVYAKGEATEDGSLGTEHSIPVLGFYGNWTDPSMYDVGSRTEYVMGHEKRYPYLYESNGISGNSVIVSYAREPGSSHYFGGNPVVQDGHYMPERNAINGVNGDQISYINFVAIRNAATSRLQVKNLSKDGEVLMETFPGSVSAAYYYSNYNQWLNTGYGLRVGFLPKRAEEGDQLELSLTLAPEYNVSYGADGSAVADWDALGEGASFRIPMVVDNTAPEVKDILVSLVNHRMLVMAKDNQYVAAVALYNAAGTELLGRVGAKQEIQAGAEAEYVLDLTNAKGNKFLLQVTDYAMNTATFQVEVQTGEQEELPEMLAFDLDQGFWTSFTRDSVSSELATYAPSDLTFYAATIVDHYVLASTEEGDLYVMPEDELTNLTRIANLGTVLSDMAYNPADGKVYGVADGSLVTVDRFTAEVQEVGKIPVTTNTLACGEDGTFYCNEYGTGKIWEFTLDSLGTGLPEKYDFNGDGTVSTEDVQALLDYATGVRSTISHGEHADFDGNGEITTRDAYLFETSLDAGDLTGAKLVVKTSLSTTQYLQTMEINPNNGLLCWVSYATLTYDGYTYGFAYYFEIDPEAGTYSLYNNLDHEMSCLIIPEKSAGSDWTTPTEEVSGIQISPETATLLKGSSTTLSAAVLPWTASDRSVTWSSSNPEVATVDENGVVTGVTPGTAMITATAVLNPDVSATCAVTVESVDITLKGALQGQGGSPVLFSWDMAQSAWIEEKELDTSLISMTQDTKNHKLYIMDGESKAWNMHRVDPATGKSEATASNAAGAPFWDLEYSQYFSTEYAPRITGVYSSYFLTPKDPMSLDTVSFNLQGYLEIAGTSALVAVTSLGYERIERYGTEYDAEHFVLLDNGGYIWNWWVYEDDEGYKNFMRLYASNLAQYESFDSYGGYRYCSLIVGEDGNLYLSAFNGETSTFYQMIAVTDAEIPHYDATPIGTVSSSASPAALYAAESGAKVESSRQVRDLTDAEPVEMADAQTGELTAARPSARFTMTRVAPATDRAEEPMSGATVGAEEREVTVEVTAKDAQGTALAANNGLATVIYDAAALELKDIQVSGDYTAQVTAAGAVTFGYIAATALEAGTPVATLTFAVKEGKNQNTYMTVTHKEANEEKPGYVEQVPVEFTHDNTELRNEKAATCTEPGYTGDTYCKDCGLLIRRGELIPALGHDYEAVVTAPTCTEQGYTTHTCSRCGDSYVDSYTQALGHDWDEGSVTTSATCEEDGVRTFTCSCCGETRTEIVPATGHTWDEGVVKQEAGCTEDGVMLYTCVSCHTTREENITATGHRYTQKVIDPTCTASGYEQYVCSQCGYEYHDHFTAPLGHDYQAVVTAPTCTEQGYTTHTCSRCEDHYVDSYTEALGHAFGQWRVIKEATCTEKGEERRTCATCGETETRAIDAKGHSLTSTVVEPTCTEAGYTEHTCTICGISYRDTIVDALGHAWSEWTVETAEDCFHPGVEVRTCAHCGAKESRAVEANDNHCPSKKFRDVDTSRWYHEGVDFVVRNGIMQGVGDDLFQPNGTLTRAQLVTTLYRMAEEPEVEGSSAFADVDMEQYYGKAVVWAADNGIAKGVSATAFAPHAPVTREQMVTFLYRYAQYAGEDVTGSYDLTEFGDQKDIQGYAREPMMWAVDQGLVIGMDGLLNPRGNATRAQIAVIFLRYCENV